MELEQQQQQQVGGYQAAAAMLQDELQQVYIIIWPGSFTLRCRFNKLSWPRVRLWHGRVSFYSMVHYQDQRIISSSS
jgi:hypothetical protein